MSRDRFPRDETEVAALLQAAARQVDYPPTPDMVAAVRERVTTGPVPARRGVVWRPRLLLPVVAIVLVAALVLALSPPARSAVASWFHLPGVVFRGGAPPGPLGRNLALGTPVPLATVRRHAGFPVLVPNLRRLGTPDAAYYNGASEGGRVTLVYGPRPGIVSGKPKRPALLITELLSRGSFLGKVIGPNVTVQQIAIGGEQALWIEGSPHVVFYRDRRGHILPDTVRLAGNVLLWDHRGMTIRVEGRLEEPEAVAIASSMLR